MEIIKFYSDGRRHLVCLPYSVDNLHSMADTLKIKRCWFHKNPYPHYDIPVRRIEEIEKQCTIISSKDIVRICKGEYNESFDPKR